jgi:hypothetical protein
MDLAVVSGHVLLPDDLTASLPPLDQGWGNFGVEDAAPPEGGLGLYNANTHPDRRNDVRRFLEGIDHTVTEGEFHFIHLLIPHRPWIFLPDGRVYPVVANPGEGKRRSWGTDAWLVEQAYQRHQIQAQYVDGIVGQMIDRLKAHHSYDDTLIVVLADHGVAVRPGTGWRTIAPETVGDIAAIPLFVKRPHQRMGEIDDYRAETVDIVPTIAGVLSLEVPWRVDGVSLFAAARPERTASVMISEPVTFEADGEEKVRVARYHLDYFGDRGPFGLAPPAHADLLGQKATSISADDEPALGVELEHPEWYVDMDPSADPLPAQLSGWVTGAGERTLWLAVAFNGRIVAVTRTWSPAEPRFVAMIPPDAFREDNEIEVLVVDGSGTERTLYRPSG